MSIGELEKRPELHIVGWVESEDDIILLVDMYTQENRALDGTYINGKVILVRLSR